MAHRTCHGPEQAQTVKNTGIPPLKTRPLPAQIQVSAISDTKKAVPRPTGCTAFFLFSIVSFFFFFFSIYFCFFDLFLFQTACLIHCGRFRGHGIRRECAGALSRSKIVYSTSPFDLLVMPAILTSDLPMIPVKRVIIFALFSWKTLIRFPVSHFPRSQLG